MSDTPKRRLGNFKVGCSYGGFGRTKAYELIEAGKIDAYKMGHQTMIDLNSVDRYHASLPKIPPGGDAPV
jgi:excisionase family DNA binding protein